MRQNFLLLLLISITASAYAQIQPIEKIAPNQPKLKQTPQLKIDSTGMTKVVSVRPPNITNLCPWIKTRGDNDFANNEVRVTVNIHFVYNMRYGDSVLKVNIALSGEENSGDRTAVSGEWQQVVYRAPAGWKIKNIRNDTTSLVTYFAFNTNVSEKFITDGRCKEREYYPANFGFRVQMPTVKDIRISVHNGNGDDFDTVGSTFNCGFKLEKVEFKYLYVTLEKT